MARTLSSMTVPDVPTNRRSGASDSRSTVVSLLISLRPGQWTKNLLVFAPLLFAVKLFDLQSVARATAGFAVFCALSSVVYLVNDVMDRDGDRRHPLKRMRPIAAGEVSVSLALTQPGLPDESTGQERRPPRTVDGGRAGPGHRPQ